MKTKICRACKRTKPYSNFYRHPLSPDGLNYICKACQLKYNRERIAKDPIKYAIRRAAYKKRYYASNKAFFNKYGRPKKPYPKVRVCPRCLNKRLREEFFISIRELSGRERLCMYCSISARSKRYWMNVHQQRNRTASWYLLRGRYLRDNPRYKGHQRNMNTTWKANAELRRRNL